MFENTSLIQVLGFIQICAGIATAVALIYAIKTYNSNKSKWQFDLAKEIQNDVTGFNRELASVDDNDNHAKTLLFERLFNILEWLGFLINKKQIKNDAIIDYFKKMVIDYYENTFLKTDYITQKQRDDKNEYPEFKKLYKDYKECKYD